MKHNYSDIVRWAKGEELETIVSAKEGSRKPSYRIEEKDGQKELVENPQLPALPPAEKEIPLPDTEVALTVEAVATAGTHIVMANFGPGGNARLEKDIARMTPHAVAMVSYIPPSSNQVEEDSKPDDSRPEDNSSEKEKLPEGTPFAEEITFLAKREEYVLPVAFIAANISIESNNSNKGKDGEKCITSSKMAEGVTQVTRETAAKYIKPGEDICNPPDAIAVTMRIYNELSEKYRWVWDSTGNEELYLSIITAAYHSGEPLVDALLERSSSLSWEAFLDTRLNKPVWTGEVYQDRLGPEGRSHVPKVINKYNELASGKKGKFNPPPSRRQTPPSPSEPQSPKFLRVTVEPGTAVLVLRLHIRGYTMSQGKRLVNGPNIVQGSLLEYNCTVVYLCLKNKGTVTETVEIYGEGPVIPQLPPTHEI